MEYSALKDNLEIIYISASQHVIGIKVLLITVVANLELKSFPMLSKQLQYVESKFVYHTIYNSL